MEYIQQDDDDDDCSNTSPSNLAPSEIKLPRMMACSTIERTTEHSTTNAVNKKPPPSSLLFPLSMMEGATNIASSEHPMMPKCATSAPFTGTISKAQKQRVDSISSSEIQNRPNSKEGTTIENFYNCSSYINNNETSSFSAVGNQQYRTQQQPCRLIADNGASLFSNSSIIRNPTTHPTSTHPTSVPFSAGGTTIARLDYLAENTTRKPKTARIRVLTMDGNDVSSSATTSWDTTDTDRNKLRSLDSSSLKSDGNESRSGDEEIPSVFDFKVAPRAKQHQSRKGKGGRCRSMSEDMNEIRSTDGSLPSLRRSASSSSSSARHSLPTSKLTPRASRRKRQQHQDPPQLSPMDDVPCFPVLHDDVGVENADVVAKNDQVD